MKKDFLFCKKKCNVAEFVIHFKEIKKVAVLEQEVLP
jgi:hypothetical protein